MCRAFPSMAWLFGTDLPTEVAHASLAGIEPKATEGRLSSFTCHWWRGADDSHRLGMVQRIRAYATGPINGTAGSASYGFGAGLPDDRAMELLEARCSTAYAGNFALYKLYGAAAAFSANAG